MNKYLEKIADIRMKPINKAKKPTMPAKNLRKTERALESTTRMKSLREIAHEKAKTSAKASAKKGRGDVAADAVKAIQRAAQTPRSTRSISSYTKQRLR